VKEERPHDETDGSTRVDDAALQTSFDTYHARSEANSAFALLRELRTALDVDGDIDWELVTDCWSEIRRIARDEETRTGSRGLR
jgi:hypothetical protein